MRQILWPVLPMLSTDNIESSNDSIFSDTPVPDSNFRTDYFSGSAQCPVPLQIALPFGTVQISFEYVCQIAIFINPVMLFVGAFFGYREFNDWIRS